MQALDNNSLLPDILLLCRDKNTMSKDWIYHTNIYEVNTRQYTKEGTFNAFAQHLPRLKDMGVQILWFMPITPISEAERQGTLGSYYACSSYTTINPEYGTLDDFKSVIKQAHELGLKVIIDWVANHTGYDHYWATENPDWYIKDIHGHFIDVNGWKDVIDLDYTNQDMRTAMIDAMKYWITECDIDGFRCDMAHLVPMGFWQEAKDACEQLKPLFWLAETEVKEYHQVFDASYAWEWMKASEKYYKQLVSLPYVQSIMQKYAEYPEDAFKLFFTANHDENSWNGTEYEKYGNAVKLMAVFTALVKGIPLVYSGQELPNLKRLHFFDKDEIEWSSHAPSLHQFYQNILTVRNSKAFSKQAATVILPSGITDDILCMLRIHEGSKVLALMNFSSQSRLRFMLYNDELNDSFTNIFSGFKYRFSAKQSFELQAWEYLVFSCG